MIFLVLIVILVTILISRVFWNKIQFNHLDKISSLLIYSLPFEFFPRIDILGSGFRLSQLLVIIGFWVLIILLLKKDKELLSHRINNVTFVPLLFIIFSFPSWFLVQDWLRFGVYWLGTILVFGAMVFIANFSKNLWSKLKNLTLILVGCSLFGLYQFVGDLVGLPTGLREHYTKAVFGVPRIQGTAVEPLYFAGMLIIAIFVLLICLYSQSSLPQPTLLSRIINIKKSHYILMLLVIVFVTFILTISKGSFAVLSLCVPVFMIMSYFKFKLWNFLIKKYFILTLFSVLLIFVTTFTFTNPIAILGSIGQNMIDTIAGTSPSAVERGIYINEAVSVLPKNSLFGIGMGQYASYVGDNLNNLNIDRKAIVNNVYLEVWLENGILTFLVFIFLLLGSLITSIKKINLNRLSFTTKELSSFCLFFCLLSYFIQWNLFSPIFIMPIFILIGLSFNQE
jgi:O-antigen ligase